MVDEREIKAWYDNRHALKGEDAWRPYEAYTIILDYLNVEKGEKLLDVGCGTGFLLKAAAERGLETYGIDISEEAVKISGKISPDSEVIEGKGEEINLPDNYFDYVTCIGALEHFINMEKGIDEITRVGREEALFCIVVPNSNCLYWKIKGKRGTEQQDINERLLSLDDWTNIFRQRGLEVINVYQDKWIFQNIRIFCSSNPLTIIKNAVCKFIGLALPLNYTYQFIFIMRKK